MPCNHCIRAGYDRTCTYISNDSSRLEPRLPPQRGGRERHRAPVEAGIVSTPYTPTLDDLDANAVQEQPVSGQSPSLPTTIAWPQGRNEQQTLLMGVHSMLEGRLHGQNICSDRHDRPQILTNHGEMCMLGKSHWLFSFTQVCLEGAMPVTRASPKKKYG